MGSLLKAIVASVLLLLTFVSAEAQAPLTLLRNVTVIDGVANAPQANRAILIDGTLIRAVLPANAPAPAGAQIVDLAGKFVIPGLIDSHSHWEDWMGELYVNHGVTSVVALENLPKALRERGPAAANYPRLYHSGERPVFGADDSEDAIRRAVAAWLRNEPDMGHFPTYNAAIARAYEIAAREVHAHGFMIFGHAEDAPAAMRAGLDVVEHVWGFTQAAMLPAELNAFQNGQHLTWATFMTDWNRQEGFIRDAVARGAYLNPTLLYEWGGMSARAQAHEIDDYLLLSDPRLVYVPRNIMEALLARHRQIKNFSSRYENMPMLRFLPEQDRAEFQDGYRKVLEFVRRYRAAGGKIQAGTDVISGGTPGLSLHHELEMLVEAGLTPMDALKSATSWSAELLEGKNRARGPAAVGTIAPGKFADLIVLGADPLRDIANTKSIERVMKNGRWVERAYHPEFITIARAAQVQAASYAPVVSSAVPNSIVAGATNLRVVLEGSGFTTRSLVRVNGNSVKTSFVSPRRIEFDMPADLVARATPNPYAAPGPAQAVGVIGDRAIPIHVFNPPPEGGISNVVHQIVRVR